VVIEGHIPVKRRQEVRLLRKWDKWWRACEWSQDEFDIFGLRQLFDLPQLTRKEICAMEAALPFFNQGEERWDSEEDLLI